VFRSVVEAYAGKEMFGFSGTEGFQEGFLEVRVQVIEHEMNRCRMPVSVEFDDACDFLCKIRVLSLVRDRNFPISSFRLHRPKDVSCAAAFVCVITPSWCPFLGVFDRSRVFEKRLGLLIETADGFERMVRFGIQVEYLLHSPDEFRRQGGNAPHFFPATA